jgi:hypothetical protein
LASCATTPRTHTLAAYLRQLCASEAAIDLTLSISFRAMSETRARLNGDQATGIDTNLSADLGNWNK